MDHAAPPEVPSTATDPESGIDPAAQTAGPAPAEADQALPNTPEGEQHGSVAEPEIAIEPADDVAGPTTRQDSGRDAEASEARGDEPSDFPASPALIRVPEEAEAEQESPRQLHPLPRRLVEFYGLLAVLFVLVPEWMAGGALFGFREGRQGSDLPAPSGAWKRLPELRLASLNLAELRLLAHESGLRGYGRQNRVELTARLLRQLRART